MPDHPLRIQADKAAKTVILTCLASPVVMTPEQAIKVSEMLAAKAHEIMPKKILKGTRLPHDWQPDADLLAWTKQERPDVDVNLTVESFKDYWEGKAGRDALKTNWRGTWRNWVRRTARGEAPRQQPPPATMISDYATCRKCHGSGMWEPGGKGKGVAQCREHDIPDLDWEPPPPEVVVDLKKYIRKMGIDEAKMAGETPWAYEEKAK